MIFLVGSCVAVLQFGVAPALPFALTLGALSLNLLASLATHPTFRQDVPLTIFHVCLLLTALFVGLGLASRLRGQVEVTEGGDFRREDGKWRAGPLHLDHLDRVSFRNEGFTISYLPGLRRGPTRNTVSWPAEAGGRNRAQIGDQDPLVLAGYRFYTTSNKGYAPVVEWRPTGGGPPVTGVLHLPGYPRLADGQEGTLDLPGVGRLEARLLIDEEVLDSEKPSEFRTPQRHRLAVRLSGSTGELKLGDSVSAPGGQLAYTELRTWMGYEVFYEWTMPWLLASASAALGSLLVYFIRVLRSQTREETASGT